jgi:hypothetical protein
MNPIAVIFVIIGALIVITAGFGSRRTARRELGTETPKELAEDKVALQERDEHEDERYESMTPQERDAYYVHPSLLARFRRFWGR